MNTVMLRTAASLAAALCIVGCAPAVDPDHVREIEEWRQRRDERLRSESGWLTLVGLDWLAPGQNTVGAAPDNDIVLPEGRVPDRVGSFELAGDQVVFRAEEGVEILLEGAPVAEKALVSDADGTPDVLKVGELTMQLIKRGDAYAIRSKDPKSPVRTGFAGMDYFPIDSGYRVDGVLRRYPEPRTTQIPTVMGTVEEMMAIGVVEFELGGEKLTLEPVVDGPEDTELFLIFRDATSGHETYPAGRFLYADLRPDDRVTLDFNKAYNPPCVFTPYATCPLPPKQNQLDVRIEAGEKDWGDH